MDNDLKNQLVSDNIEKQRKIERLEHHIEILETIKAKQTILIDQLTIAFLVAAITLIIFVTSAICCVLIMPTSG